VSDEIRTGDVAVAAPSPSTMPQTVAQPLNLTMMASSCTSGTCPTVYESGRGTLVIQGYEVPTASAGVAVPSGERLVEIPIELLREAARLLP
jgi:hypothetical protein